MTGRITAGVARAAPVCIEVDGRSVQAYEGESVATALMAAGIAALSTDRSGRPRGVFCNMGVCYDCVVLLQEDSVREGAPLRVRACLTGVRAGMRIRTRE